MNGRNSSHRVQHWQLAERQRYLAELESLGARLVADVERLRDEIDQAGGADVTSESGFDLVFIRPLLDRRDKLLRSISEVDAQLVDARAALVTAQQEVRLIEGSVIQRGLKFEDRMTRRSRRSV